MNEWSCRGAGSQLPTVGIQGPEIRYKTKHNGFKQRGESEEAEAKEEEEEEEGGSSEFLEGPALDRSDNEVARSTGSGENLVFERVGVLCSTAIEALVEPEAALTAVFVSVFGFRFITHALHFDHPVQVQIQIQEKIHGLNVN